MKFLLKLLISLNACYFNNNITIKLRLFIVFKGGSTLHSWMAKQLSVKNKDDHIDPRERILRHAKVKWKN